jgi:hypothetical protein
MDWPNLSQLGGGKEMQLKKNTKERKGNKIQTKGTQIHTPNPHITRSIHPHKW